VRVLVVGDDPLVAQSLLRSLRRQGWAVDAATDLIEARWLVGEINYDALVLDVHLPDGNGIDFCVDLRAAGTTTPVLLLTTQSEVTNRVHGLDCGADDFLAKPFSAAELAARLRALARRAPATMRSVLRVGELIVNPADRTAIRAGRPITLTAREFALVHLLARNPVPSSPGRRSSTLCGTSPPSPTRTPSTFSSWLSGSNSTGPSGYRCCTPSGASATSCRRLAYPPPRAAGEQHRVRPKRGKSPVTFLLAPGWGC